MRLKYFIYINQFKILFLNLYKLCFNIPHMEEFITLYFQQKGCHHGSLKIEEINYSN